MSENVTKLKINNKNSIYKMFWTLDTVKLNN